MLNTKRMHFPTDIILVCIRWYVAYPLSYRHIEKMMKERNVPVDHASINRWSILFLTLLEKIFRQNKRPTGRSWRMDKTYLKVKGIWKYLYRSADETSKTVDQLFGKDMYHTRVLGKVMVDRTEANKATPDKINNN